MEIHKPKPIHSWREFFVELATIMLGVSLALAAEQTVEWFHWRSQVKESREFIATETAENLVTAITRIRTAQCIERRLDSLAQILDDAAGGSDALPPVGDISQPARRLWRNGTWESVVASQTATHFSRQELADLASLYKFVERGEAYLQVELEAWSDLSAMVGPGRHLDSASEAQLRAALGRARTYNRSMTSISSIVMAQVRHLGLPFGSNDLRIIDAALRESLTHGKATPTNPSPMFLICQPIGAVAPHYGQAPMGTVPGFMEGNVKQLDDFAASVRSEQP